MKLFASHTGAGALLVTLCACSSIGVTQPAVSGVVTKSPAPAPLVLLIDKDREGESCTTTKSASNFAGRYTKVAGGRAECCPTGFAPAGLHQSGADSYSLVCLEQSPAGRMATTVNMTTDGKECLGVGYTPEVCCPDGWSVVGRVNADPGLNMYENVICLSP